MLIRIFKKYFIYIFTIICINNKNFKNILFLKEFLIYFILFYFFLKKNEFKKNNKNKN